MSSRLHQKNRTCGLATALVALGCCPACEGQWVTLGHASSVAFGGSANTSAAAGGNPGNTIAGAAGNGGGLAGGGSSSAAIAPEFVDVVRIPSLASNYADDNPTLTSDLRELYFTSKNRPGGKGNVDVWVAKRQSATANFDAPVPVLSVSTNGVESSPAISANGLTLWVGAELTSAGLGGYDILRATRASRSDDFGAPSLVPELSSTEDDIPRPLGNHQLTMPLSSRRASALYLTYFATRPNTDADFAQPILMEELVVDGANVSDAFLSEDGLVLYFARSVDGLADLFVARRPTTESPFGTALPLSTINTSNDDRDPWLSADGTVFFFSSDRDSPGTLNIYQARLSIVTSDTSGP